MMGSSPLLLSKPPWPLPFLFSTRASHLKRVSLFTPPVHGHGLRLPSLIAVRSKQDAPSSSSSPSASASSSSSPATSASSSSSSSAPIFQSTSDSNSPGKAQAIEEDIEKVIYRCRFLTLLGVFGSLIGSFLCFIKGSTRVIESFVEYVVNHGKVILLLVEAIDVYLLGTVMLVFGMGLYELFVSNLGTEKSQSEEKASYRSNLFGLFTLKERPKWLDIKTVNDLKTKLGHVIVMLLLIGLFDKSKKAAINSPLDLLCFSASILLSSGCLFLLSKLID